jgi:hypothetical protein
MNSFSGCLSLEGKLWSTLVVFGLPPLQFSSQILLVPKVFSSLSFAAASGAKSNNSGNDELRPCRGRHRSSERQSWESRQPQ